MGSPTTLDDCLVLYVNKSGMTGSSVNSVYSSTRDLSLKFGKCNVEDISAFEIVGFRERKIRDGYSPLTVKTMLGYASSAINFCNKELDLNLSNRFAGRTISKQDQLACKPNKRILTLDEQAAIFSKLTPPMHEVALFALGTGLRQGEICSLSWDQIEGDTIIFPPEKTKSGKWEKCKMGTVALSIVENWPDGQPKIFGVNPRGIQRAWKEACEKAGVEGAGFHCLRKTCGSRMLQAGARMEDVKAQLRHSDIRTTQMYYAEDDVEGAAEFLP